MSRERVRVTRTPRRLATDRPPSLREEVEAQSGLGAAYVDSLIRAQRGLSVRLATAVIVVVTALPLLFLLVPTTRTATVLGLPLPWLLLGVVLYPLIVLAAWLFVRASERLEASFSDVVDPH